MEAGAQVFQILDSNIGQAISKLRTIPPLEIKTGEELLYIFFPQGEYEEIRYGRS
jgi:hypothetical protein